mmetsp:Transcript_14789/g.27371  ORF Transcript_14789/g.27371 Transcript_14789/m.27371 type:complete len:454 (-) Transcript_14789:56-1417(-)
MFYIRQFTNFVVSHVIWYEIILIPNYATNAVFLYNGGCGWLYVNKFIWTSMGITVFIARYIDVDFRESLRALFYKRVKVTGTLKRTMNKDSSMNCISDPRYDDFGSFAIFKSLQVKFILDSLLALSIKFVVTIDNDTSDFMMRPYTKESFFTVDADEIRETVENENILGLLDDYTAHRYNVVEYYPHIFKDLRERLKITNSCILQALSPVLNLSKLSGIAGLKGGSSGAFIYTTYDSKYVLKTISTKEKLTLLNRLLNSYMERLMFQDSALVRILGVYQVQCVSNYSTNLVLMENVSTSVGVLAKFDLKGSLYGRRSNPTSVLGKDLNFIETIEHLNLERDEATRLVNCLRHDALMLSKHNLMDYSILVTICEEESLESVSGHYIYRSTRPGEYYLIALIDFLQEYTLKRKIEKFWKSKIKGVPRNLISVAEPKIYYERFIKFIESICGHDAE